MKNNAEEYLKKSKKELEDVLLKIHNNEIKIEDLDDIQKNQLLYYFSNKISIQKKRVKEIREEIKKEGSKQ